MEFTLLFCYDYCMHVYIEPAMLNILSQQLDIP